jgi:hypothetical protein
MRARIAQSFGAPQPRADPPPVKLTLSERLALKISI